MGSPRSPAGLADVCVWACPSFACGRQCSCCTGEIPIGSKQWQSSFRAPQGAWSRSDIWLVWAEVFHSALASRGSRSESNFDFKIRWYMTTGIVSPSGLLHSSLTTAIICISSAEPCIPSIAVFAMWERIISATD